MINFILNSISVIATYIVAVGFLFFVFNRFLKFLIPFEKDNKLFDILNFIISNILIFTFSEFYLPWK